MLKIKHNKLYLHAIKVKKFFDNYIMNINKPDEIYTHSWEGGHEDRYLQSNNLRNIKKNYKLKIVINFHYIIHLIHQSYFLKFLIQ